MYQLIKTIKGIFLRNGADFFVAQKAFFAPLIDFRRPSLMVMFIEVTPVL
jgi:hypothetical protein